MKIKVACIDCHLTLSSGKPFHEAKFEPVDPGVFDNFSFTLRGPADAMAWVQIGSTYTLKCE